MSDFIATVVVIAIIGAALAYVINQKRKGIKCSGCSGGCSCDTKQNFQNNELSPPSCQKKNTENN